MRKGIVIVTALSLLVAVQIVALRLEDTPEELHR